MEGGGTRGGGGEERVEEGGALILIRMIVMCDTCVRRVACMIYIFYLLLLDGTGSVQRGRSSWFVDDYPSLPCDDSLPLLLYVTDYIDTIHISTRQAFVPLEYTN